MGWVRQALRGITFIPLRTTINRAPVLTGMPSPQRRMNLSIISVGLLEDLGWEVNYDAADPY
jgi:hypothetical protein